MLAIWVREALKHANMSGAELSRRLSERLNRSVDRAAVQKMQMTEATGKTKPRQISADELFAIAEITGYPVPAEFESGLTAARVPMISWVSAGVFSRDDVSQDILGVTEVAGLPQGDWIALRVEGDSMDRISPPGSVILVDRSDTRLIPNGCYIIANSEGEATYKRYRPSPVRFEPVSTNPSHEPIWIDGDQMPAVYGRVKKSILDM